MKSNKGITLTKLIAIVVIFIVIIAFIILNFNTDISQCMSIFNQMMTGQINIDEEIAKNEILLGITDVKGEGIVINILDGQDLIHQEDLIIMIDELKNSGAQAISINDQRITNSTYLYCDGAVILIDGEKIGNPFTIKAIGDSETIYGAITRNKGYISVLEKDKLEVNIEKSDNVEIVKTKNKTLLNYGENKNAIEKLKISNQLIGKADMRNSGIEVEIKETKAKLSALSFLQMINDLNSGGAKAISINGQRVTSMTDIMDISNTYVLINSIPISGPYIIEAIGDKEKLEEALYYSNSQYNKIRTKGNEVQIYEVPYLTVNQYVQKKDKNKMTIDYLK